MTLRPISRSSARSADGRAPTQRTLSIDVSIKRATRMHQSKKDAQEGWTVVGKATNRTFQPKKIKKTQNRSFATGKQNRSTRSGSVPKKSVVVTKALPTPGLLYSAAVRRVPSPAKVHPTTPSPSESPSDEPEVNTMNKIENEFLEMASEQEAPDRKVHFDESANTTSIFSTDVIDSWADEVENDDDKDHYETPDWAISQEDRNADADEVW